MSMKGMFKWTGAGEWSNKSADEQRESIRRGAKAVDEFAGGVVMGAVFFLITIGIAAVAWPLAIPVGIGLAVCWWKAVQG